MNTQYTATRPLPWCDRCQTHHVLAAGDLCPICADTPAPTVPIALPGPPPPAPAHPPWVEKLLRGNGGAA